jgi:hypothetical protein
MKVVDHYDICILCMYQSFYMTSPLENTDKVCFEFQVT